MKEKRSAVPDSSMAVWVVGVGWDSDQSESRVVVGGMEALYDPLLPREAFEEADQRIVVGIGRVDQLSIVAFLLHLEPHPLPGLAAVECNRYRQEVARVLLDSAFDETFLVVA